MTYVVTDEQGARLAEWPRALRPTQSPCHIDRSKGVHQHRCSAWHADVVEGYRLWVASVEAQCEAEAIGYATEQAEFWAARGGRPTFRDYLAGLRGPVEDAA